MTLEEAIAKIKPLDHNAMEIAQKRWDSIAKPLHSLGKLEIGRASCRERV